MDNLDFSYDHYKDTFDLIQKREAHRNKLFLMVAIVLLLFLCIAVQPNEAQETFTNFISSEINSKITINFASIQTFLWASLVYLFTQYFSLCVDIDRKYIYLHIIEKEVKGEHTFTFSREGESYIKDYPAILNSKYISYAIIFPLLYVICIVVKICSEFNNTQYYWIPDLILASVCLVYVVLYVGYKNKGKIKTLSTKKK